MKKRVEGHIHVGQTFNFLAGTPKYDSANCTSAREKKDLVSSIVNTQMDRTAGTYSALSYISLKYKKY